MTSRGPVLPGRAARRLSGAGAWPSEVGAAPSERPALPAQAADRQGGVRPLGPAMKSRSSGKRSNLEVRSVMYASTRATPPGLRVRIRASALLTCPARRRGRT
jgi:hypothetical protein